MRVQNRQYLPVAFQGFGKSPAQDPEFVAASHLAQEAIRKGRTLLLSGDSDDRTHRSEKQEKKAQLGPLVHRAVLAVPFMTEERIFGAIYLDKPMAVGRFVVRDQVLLENFAQHAAVALNNRREFETAIRDPLTGYYTFSYFNERLREAYRWFNLHGKSFTLVGYYLPGLEEALGDGRNEVASSLARELNEALPRSAALCWGSPILYVLLSDVDVPVADALARKVCDSLTGLLGTEVPMEILPVHGRFQHGSEILFELKNRLTPSPCDPKTVSELRMLLADDVSLREAKKILEKHKIESTLRKTGGNITHAARELGIHRPQLSSLLKKYALKREVFESETVDGDGEVESSPAKN